MGSSHLLRKNKGMEVCFWVDSRARPSPWSTENPLGFLKLLTHGGLERDISRLGTQCMRAGRGGPLLLPIASF